MCGGLVSRVGSYYVPGGNIFRMFDVISYLSFVQRNGIASRGHCDDVVLERTCQENCSAITDSILLCGFDTVLRRRNSKSKTVR